MPAGLQVFGDAGTFQIDGSTPHVTLLRKGVVGMNQGHAQSNLGGVTSTTIPLNDGEVLAFASEGFNTVQWCRYNGQAVMVSPNAPVGALLYYWVFSQHQSSGLNYGMQVFSETGALIYDTGRPTMNIVGTYMGQGLQTFPASRVAVIPWQIYARTDRRIVYTNVGTKPDFMAFIFADAGAVATGGGGVDCRNMTVHGNASGPYSQASVFPSNWVYEGTNGLDNRFTVVDVSNL